MKLEEKYKKAVQALKDIENPLSMLREKSKREGGSGVLDAHMALKYSNDARNSKKIAKKCLVELGEME